MTSEKITLNDDICKCTHRRGVHGLVSDECYDCSCEGFVLRKEN